MAERVRSSELAIRSDATAARQRAMQMYDEAATVFEARKATGTVA